MNRYVLVCNITGEALKFHEKLTNEVCFKFNKKRQKLPAHFTLKAPFETDKIEDMVNILETFSQNRHKEKIKIEDYGKFREDVIYMNINLSKEAKALHDELIDELSNISWLVFKENEGKDKVFHCTIVSRRIQDEFKNIWKYVTEYPCSFNCYFDNLCLYIWKDNTWKVYERFYLK